MKFLCSIVISFVAVSISIVTAFQPAFITTTTRSSSSSTSSTGRSTVFVLYQSSGLDLSGNTWKPDSGKMGSTDTGDYFPDDFDLQEAQDKFKDGMMGSQQFLNRNKDGPQLPGLENLGSDAIIQGGITTASEIPAGMQFVPSSVPDGEYTMKVASSSSGGSIQLPIQPFCMSYEDYYAAFAPGSHPSLSVGPVAGRMDRRGGEPTILTIACQPNGQAGEFIGMLVVNLPEDNSKLTYKIIAQCY